MTLTLKRHAIVALMILGSASGGGLQAKDIVDTAVEAGSFKTLAAALQAADLVNDLKSKGPFTVFAPTDEAFSKLPEGTVETLLKPENKQKLVEVLTYHVVKGKVASSEAMRLPGAKTLNSQWIDIKLDSGKVTVDGATVIKADIFCDNGVIHVIDRVILPATDDIVSSASKDGKFKTLLAAAKAAGLAETLATKGPFTIFAPTDDAFAKLPASTLETLLKPENKAQLAAILKYHVVAGRVYSTDALAAGKAITLQGQPVTFSVDGKAASVNDAKLVATDIDASNGVIHVIDSVLLPPDKGSAVNVRQMIESAIAEGSSLYNSGHADQCARIYMTTASNILASNDHGMCSSTTHMLQTALTHSKRTGCANTQAWTMRRALDVAYNNVR